MKKSLTQEICDVVLELGECTSYQIVIKIGGIIDASQAANASRRYLNYENKMDRTHPPWSLDQLIERGRKRLVLESLSRLTKTGRIRRVRKGVYAPPKTETLQ